MHCDEPASYAAKCCECGGILCHEHVLDCGYCRKPLCWECDDSSESRLVWKCERCHDRIGKEHENCRIQKILSILEYGDGKHLLSFHGGSSIRRCGIGGCKEPVCHCRQYQCGECDEKHLFCDDHEETGCREVLVNSEMRRIADMEEDLDDMEGASDLDEETESEEGLGALF